MLYKKVACVAATVYLFLSTPIYGSTYYVSSVGAKSASNNPYTCSSVNNCRIYCDVGDHKEELEFHCGSSGSCVFYCAEQKCGNKATIYGENADSLVVYGQAKECLKDSVVYAPNSGSAYFFNGNTAEKPYKGMDVYSGSNTQEIIVNCDGTSDADECKGTNVYASNAQFLRINVAYRKALQEVTIECPADSSYAPSCIIDAETGYLYDLTIYAPWGTPKGLIITGASSYSNVLLYCTTVNSLNGPSEGRESYYPFTESDDCWWTDNPTLAPSLSPTASPTNPTMNPSAAPTISPTLAPTKPPTLAPTDAPSTSPTLTPTKSPTLAPTNIPTSATKPPTISPTNAPTYSPTAVPSYSPTKAPTSAPTQSPTYNPTNAPTISPTSAPTQPPTQSPSDSPTQPPTIAPTQPPTRTPSVSPTQPPTLAPTIDPTHAPTIAPTQPPTLAPTQPPTHVPTLAPTQPPTLAPTQPPTIAPTLAPTQPPTRAPTKAPSIAPTREPTIAPTDIPTLAPTKSPTLAPTDAPTISPTAAPTFIWSICDTERMSECTYVAYITFDIDWNAADYFFKYLSSVAEMEDIMFQIIQSELRVFIQQPNMMITAVLHGMTDAAIETNAEVTGFVGTDDGQNVDSLVYEIDKTDNMIDRISRTLKGIMQSDFPQSKFELLNIVGEIEVIRAQSHAQQKDNRTVGTVLLVLAILFLCGVLLFGGWVLYRRREQIKYAIWDPNVVHLMHRSQKPTAIPGVENPGSTKLNAIGEESSASDTESRHTHMKDDEPALSIPGGKFKKESVGAHAPALKSAYSESFQRAIDENDSVYTIE